MVDVDTGKYISAFICAALTFLGAVLPIFIKAFKWTNRFQSLAGGVFLGGCLAHLIPDSIADITKATTNPYPITGAVCACTFFLLSAIEILSSHITKSATEVDSSTGRREMEENLTDPGASDDGKNRTLFDKKFKWLSVSVTTLYIIMDAHSIIEGLALGIVDNLGGVIGMACAVAGHKPLEAFALGLVLLRDRPVKWVYWSMMIFYVLLSPLGAIIAIQLRHLAGGVLLGVLTAMSAGTFLFIASDEWATVYLNRHNFSTGEKLWHLGMFLLGMMWMLLIALLDE